MKKEIVDRTSGDMWQTTSREDIKQFYSEKIKEILEDIRPERRCLDDFPITGDAVQTTFTIIWNQVSEEVNKKISEML